MDRTGMGKMGGKRSGNFQVDHGTLPPSGLMPALTRSCRSASLDRFSILKVPVALLNAETRYDAIITRPIVVLD